MDIASHLHMTDDEAKRKIRSSKFVEWCVYLRQKRLSEANNDHLNRYLAQICVELIRLPTRFFGGKFPDATLKDFLLTFEEKKAEPEQPEPEEVDADELERRMAASKSVWCGFLGIKPEGE